MTKATGKPFPLKRLEAFDQAWEASDLERLAEFLAEDCVYSASRGPEPGTTYTGKQEVMRGFEHLLEIERQTSVAARSACTAEQLAALECVRPQSERYLYGDRAFTTWAYLGILTEGSGDQPTRVGWIRGCDFFEFSGNLILRKDAFIKRGE